MKQNGAIKILTVLALLSSSSSGMAKEMLVAKPMGRVMIPSQVQQNSLNKLTINKNVTAPWQGQDLKSLKGLFEQITQMGGNSGGGGDDLGIEFKEHFVHALNEIKEKDQQLYKQVQDLNLEKIGMNAKVIVVDDVLDVNIKGLIQNSVAYNSPVLGVILVNRSRWEKITKNKLRSAIALHEVASLVGAEQTGLYNLSARYSALDSGSDATILKDLKTQLNVNRVQQLSSESLNKAEPVKILQRLFDEANETVSINDLKKTASKYECAAAGKRSSTKDKWVNLGLRSVTIKTFDYVKNEYVPAKPSYGPLFPGISEVPAETEERFFLDIPGANMILNGELLGSVFRIGNSEIEHSYDKTIEAITWSKHRESFRKNNDALVFRSQIEVSVDDSSSKEYTEFFGYCYPTAKK